MKNSVAGIGWAQPGRRIVTAELDVHRLGNEQRRQRHVEVGAVKAEEPLVSLESDKATMEVSIRILSMTQDR